MITDGTLEELLYLPRFTPGEIEIEGKPFKYHDAASFYHTYCEIFREEIYKFIPVSDKAPIIDCGTNMGLSLLYFSENYPGRKIIAFEPDPDLYRLSLENIEAFNLQNISLLEMAVWNEQTFLPFYTDGGMGGRVNQSYHNTVSRSVPTVRLFDFLNEETEFLKLDIEGAEHLVLSDIYPRLVQVNHLFFEYHNQKNKRQVLHDMLKLVQDAGFTYYLKESAHNRSPFANSLEIAEVFDMAINVFCYRKP